MIRLRYYFYILTVLMGLPAIFLGSRGDPTGEAHIFESLFWFGIINIIFLILYAVLTFNKEKNDTIILDENKNFSMFVFIHAAILAPIIVDFKYSL